jgi:hypothetical protein
MCVFCRKKTENSNLVSTDTAGLGDDALHVLNLSLAAGEGTELWWMMISWVLWDDTEIRAEKGVTIRGVVGRHVVETFEQVLPSPI